MRDKAGLRIIGGRWRGRRLPVPSNASLRPTPDRVRETLFNWLAPFVEGARCLDLFAGTGALGLEALSRGAAVCTFVEHDRRLAEAIRAHLDTLGCGDGEVVCGDGVTVLDRLPGTFDLVFLDPPFADGLFPALLARLPPRLSGSHRVYCEFPIAAPPAVPSSWQRLRDKRAGQVGYCLACYRGGGEDTRS